jgi:hypothetical protein
MDTGDRIYDIDKKAEPLLALLSKVYQLQSILSLNGVGQTHLHCRLNYLVRHLYTGQ